MKNIIVAITLLGVAGCLPQLPKLPEVPDIPEVPDVKIPEIEAPTTLPFPTAPETAPLSQPAFSAAPVSDTRFNKTCIAGFVETGPNVGTVDIYSPSKWSPNIQSISGISKEFLAELELESC